MGARGILVRLNGAQGVCGTRWRELHSFWVRMRVGHQPAVRPAPGAGPCLSQAREARKETWGREACIYDRHAKKSWYRPRRQAMGCGKMQAQAPAL